MVDRKQARIYRQAVKILIDTCLFVAAIAASYLLRFSPDTALVRITEDALPLVILTVVVRIGVYMGFRLHSSMWRFVGTHELLNIIKAASLGTFIIVIAVYFLRIDQLYRMIVVLEWLLVVFFTGGVRFVARWFYEHRSRTGERDVDEKRVVIYGAGRAGELLLRDIYNSAHSGIEVVGFIDDDPVKKGQYIHNRRVLGTGMDLREIVNKYLVTDIYFAISALSGVETRRILSLINEQVGDLVEVRTIPGLKDLVDGRVDVNQLRKVEITDLLRRKPIQLDFQPVQRVIGQSKVLVAGGGGSIGSELCRQIADFHPRQLLIIDSGEYNLYQTEINLREQFPDVEVVGIVADVTNGYIIRKLFREYQPDILFHAAAYKHVPLMESNPWSAVYNNIRGTLVLAEVAREFNLQRFVMVSTDKAVAPTNVMGATKRICEQIVMALSQEDSTRFMAVRFGNVLGSSGSVIPRFRRQIELGGPVQVTHPEITRYFMLVAEAVELVLQAASTGENGKVYILDMGPPIRIVDLAKYMIELSGLRVDQDIKIEFTGLRPGEKLHERLHLDQEEVLSHIPGVYVLKPPETNLDGYIETVRKLISECYQLSLEQIRERLIELVPEYTPDYEQQARITEEALKTASARETKTIQPVSSS